jgi:hypothetical protein
MATQNRNENEGPRATAAASETPRASARKPFVEPAISHPVDVLEATTFFQVVDSGGTGRPKRPTGEGLD